MRRGMSRPAVVSVLSLALIATAGVASPAISATPQFRPAVAPASLKDDVEAAKAKDSAALVKAMQARYPKLAGVASLELSAKVAKGEMQWP